MGYKSLLSESFSSISAMKTDSLFHKSACALLPELTSLCKWNMVATEALQIKVCGGKHEQHLVRTHTGH